MKKRKVHTVGKKQQRELERLENHLMAEDARQVESAEAYNRDDIDLNLERYSRKVYGKKRGGCLVYGIILVILAALALFLYQVLGGSGYAG